MVPARETIRNPAFWDRPENMGQYRDDRQNLYLDGMGNLVIRATREGDRYFGAKIQGRQWIGIGHTWEARIKLECLTPGAWPAFWMLNDRLGQGGEIDVLEWFGNGGWGPGSTVHTRLDGTTAANHPIVVDPNGMCGVANGTPRASGSGKTRCPACRPISMSPPGRWRTGGSTTPGSRCSRC